MASVPGALTSTFIRKEATYGVYPATAWTDANTTKLHFSSSDLPLNKLYTEDPGLLGLTYAADKIPAGTSIVGSLNFSVHPEQLGWIIYFGLGEVKNSNKIYTGAMAIIYNGANESTLISKSGNTLSALTGSSGSEVADTNFNTTGSIDLTNASFDTLTELAAAITAYTGYDAYVISGGSAKSADIPDFTATQANLQTVKLESIAHAAITVKYTGAQASCLLAKSGTNLTSSIGSIGAESPDAAWGSAGSIDLTNASFDTVGELAAAINVYADYEATVVSGGSLASSLLDDFLSTQAKSVDVSIANTYAGAGYRTRFIPTTLGNSKKSFSIRQNKSVENPAYTGCKIGELSLDITPRQLITGTAQVVAQNVTSGSALTGITTEDTRSFVASNVRMWINGTESFDVKKIAFKNNPNLDVEDTIVGSDLIAEPDNQAAQCTIDVDLRYNASTLTYKTAYENGTEVEVILYGEVVDEVETGKPYAFWVRIPRCKITACTPNISGPEKIIMPTTFEVMSPIYNSFSAIEWDILTKVSDYTA